MNRRQPKHGTLIDDDGVVCRRALLSQNRLPPVQHKDLLTFFPRQAATAAPGR